MGFKSIARPGDTKLNQKAPALIKPQAVRAVDVEIPKAKATVLPLAPQQVPKTTAADVLDEAEMEVKRITLGGERPGKRQKIEFYLDDSHRESPDPSETGAGTKIHSQVWIWGALILLLLGVVTFRHRF